MRNAIRAAQVSAWGGAGDELTMAIILRAAVTSHGSYSASESGMRGVGGWGFGLDLLTVKKVVGRIFGRALASWVGGQRAPNSAWGRRGCQAAHVHRHVGVGGGWVEDAVDKRLVQVRVPSKIFDACSSKAPTSQHAENKLDVKIYGIRTRVGTGEGVLGRTGYTTPCAKPK